MNVDTFATVLTWLIVLATAVGAILAVVLRRAAAKVFGLLFFVLIAVTVFAVREDVMTLAEDNRAALCAGRVSYYGLDLVGGSARCPAG